MYGSMFMFALSYLVLAVVSPVPETRKPTADPVSEPERNISGLIAGRSSSSRSHEGEPSEDTIYVALGKDDKENKSILSWTLERFKGKKIFIIHVHKPALLIPKMGAKFPESSLTKQEVDAYRKIEEQNVEKALREYLLICRKKVQAEKHYITKKCVKKGIMELISQLNIRNLVMGAAGERYHYWRMTEVKSKKARYVRENAPDSCQIWFVYKGKEVIYTRKLDGAPTESAPSSPQATGQNSDTAAETVRSPTVKSASKKMKTESLKSSSALKFCPCFETTSTSIDLKAEEFGGKFTAEQKPSTIVSKLKSAECSHYFKGESSKRIEIEESISADAECIMATVDYLIDKSVKREPSVASSFTSDVSAPLEVDLAGAKETLAEFLNQDLKSAAENPNKEKIVSAALLLSRSTSISPELKSFLINFANELNHIASSFSISSASFSQATQNLKTMQEAKDHIFATRRRFQDVETTLSEASEETESLASEIKELEEILSAMKRKQEAKSRKITQLRNERKHYVIELRKQSSELAETQKMVDEWRSTEESTALHVASLTENWNKWKTNWSSRLL